MARISPSDSQHPLLQLEAAHSPFHRLIPEGVFEPFPVKVYLADMPVLHAPALLLTEARRHSWAIARGVLSFMFGPPFFDFALLFLADLRL